MMRVTFLGYTSFLVSSNNDSVLIDPVLFDQFGNGPPGKRYPETFMTSSWLRYDRSRIPQPSALIISHEHEDHFNIQSINTLPRSTPVYISAHSSSSLRRILGEMGFSSVSSIPEKKPVKIGSLRLQAIPPPHFSNANDDEWDVMPIVLSDSAGDVAFLNTVDRDVRLLIRDYTATEFKAKIRSKKILTYSGRKVLFSNANGLFGSAKQWQQSNSLKNKSNKKALLGGKTVPLETGLTIAIEKRTLALANVEQSALRTLKSKDHRTFAFAPKSIAPLDPKIRLNTREWEILLKELNDWALALYLSPLFPALLSCQSKRALKTFVLILHSDQKPRAFGYSFQTGSFIELERSPSSVESALCSFTCYARDLLSVIQGEHEPRLLNFGHSRWDADSAFVDFERLAQIFWNHFHPLRRQPQALKRYRACVRRLKND